MRWMHRGLVLAVALVLGCGGNGGDGDLAGDLPDGFDGVDAADAPDADVDAPPPTDLLPDGTDADAPDTGDAAELPDQPDGTQGPILDLWFDTANGPKGKAGGDVDLFADDEIAAYRNVPGFQVDVTVATLGLEDGRDVVLKVAGTVVDQRKVAVDAATGTGLVTFPGVTLTHAPDGIEVAAEATNAAGQTGSTTRLTRVDIGTCGVSLTPKNAGCLLADADPGTPGVQVAFTVTNPDRTCGIGLVGRVGRDGTIAGTPVILDASGQATFVVTVSDQDAPDGAPVTLAAEVGDGAAPGRTGRTADLVYTVDLSDPVLAVTHPDRPVLSLADDNDGLADNGLQVDVAGTAAGIADGAEVALLINGQLADTVVPQDGAFVFANATLPDDGEYVLEVQAQDACGRPGTASRTVQARLSRANHAFLYPTEGTVVPASADTDPATPRVLNGTFRVRSDAAAGTTLEIRCRRDVAGGAEVTAGFLRIQAPDGNGEYAIPVALDTAALTRQVACRIADDAPNPGTSTTVAFTVALPAPLLKVLSPKAGAWFRVGPIPAALYATGLDGRTPTARVLDAAGTALVTVTAAAPIQGGSALVQVPLADGGVALPDGAYVLAVDARDEWGNEAADNPASVARVPFGLDSTPPTATITAPAADVLDPGANPADADADPVQAGHQADVTVSAGGGDGDGTRVCLRAGSLETCSVLAGGGTTATFRVTLLPGPNDLAAWAVDPAGNRGDAPGRTITLAVNAPRIRIVSPVADGPVAAVPFSLVAVVTNAGSDALVGVDATLAADGTDVASVQTDATGRAVFPVSALATTPVRFVVRATASGGTGFSSPRTLYLKSGQPTLEFQAPRDGDTVNLAYAACAPGAPDCAMDATLAAANLEDGVTGTLVVDCGAGSASVPGVVESAVLTFAGTVLRDQATCTLTATAVDLVGQAVAAGPVQVRVDRIAPVVQPLQVPALLDYLYDEDPVLAGLQTTIRVTVGGVEAGRTLRLAWGLPGGATQEVTQDLPAIADGQSQTFTMPTITLPDGTVQVTASTSDAAGNPGTTSTLVSVWADLPQLRLYLPTFVADAECATASECGTGGACLEGRCAIPWGLASSRILGVDARSLPAGEKNLRVCSNHPAVAGPGCSSAGYRQVALVDGVPGLQVVAPAVPDGRQSLIAEAQVADGRPWVSSLDNPRPAEQVRHVFQDLVAPVVTSLGSPSDTLDPAGVLNAAEQTAAGRIYGVAVGTSEAGTVTLTVNGVALAEQPTTGAVTIDAALDEGANEVWARARDAVGNTSAAPPQAVTYAPRVDTAPPTLAFLRPTRPTLNAQDSLDVELSSDAVGRTVQLVLDGAPAASAEVPADGIVRFPHATTPLLTDGIRQLSASVTDDAGNPAAAFQEVLVDTAPPGMALFTPQDAAVLADADDAQPEVPGFQVGLSFAAMSPDAVAWTVQVAANCDAAFVTCDPPATLRTGAVTAPGELEPTVYATLFGASTPYYKFLVLVSDAVGNVSSRVARVTVELVSCQVSLSGITAGGWVNNGACIPAGQDCATARKTLTVAFTAACGEIDDVKLLVAGGGTLSAAPAGQAATFDLDLGDGTSWTVEGRAFLGAGLAGTSGPVSFQVDLASPVVTFEMPAAGDLLWGADADALAGFPGFQSDLRVRATDDHLAGGQVAALTVDTGTGATALAPLNVALPLSLAATPATVDLLGVTLADQARSTVEVTIADAAGNEGRARFTATVDAQAPAAIGLDAPGDGDILPRRPGVRLRWTAVGDNGTQAGTRASAYDIRYSRDPIGTDDDFDRACPVAALAWADPVTAPKVAGSLESFTISGPDLQPARLPDGSDNPCKFVTGSPGEATYSFAVRAVDDAGNRSPLGTASVLSVDLGLRVALLAGAVAPYDGVVLQSQVGRVGDLDGDGKADAVLGGLNADLVCVAYGRAEADGTVPDLSIDAATGDAWQCLAGTGNWLGTFLAYAGDLNGDGVDDLALGEGRTAATYRVLVYLGVRGGRLPAAPNVTITGMTSSPTPGVVLAGGANFNGDASEGRPVLDLVIGSKGENRAYVVPGNAAWDAGTSVAIDLKSATDRAAANVTTLALATADPFQQFGLAVGFLRDVNADGFDEAVVSTQRGATWPGGVAVNSQVLVIQGRASAGDVSLSYSPGNAGTGDDARAARVAQAAGAVGLGSGGIAGLADLDHDGRGDLVLGHPGNTGGITVLGVYGSALASAFGSGIRPDPAATVGDLKRDATAFAISGPYTAPITVGNFDDDPAVDGSVDLAYVLYQPSLTYGKVILRTNVRDDAAGIPYGAFPYAAPTLVDPLDPAGTRFGTTAAGIGDFNGDGHPDILVGNDGSGYATLLY